MTQRRIRVGFPASKFRTLASSPLALSVVVNDSDLRYRPIQAAGSDRVQIGNGSTSWLAADVLLGNGSGYPGTAGKWTVNPGGDWLDSSGTFNGSSHYAQAAWPVGTTTAQFDISAIDGDLIVRGLQGWDSASIDGTPAVSFTTDTSSAGSLSMPRYLNHPGFVMNPSRGSTLTLTRSSFTGTAQTATIDKAAGPLIPTYPFGPTSATPTVATLDLSSESALIAQVGSGNMAQPYAYNPEFLTDANGFKYFRFTGGPTTGSRLISWFWHFGQQLTHGFFRYCLWIEDDVADGMTELGMKLPGAYSDAGNGTSNISLRTEHGPVSQVAANRGLYKFIQYTYDYDENAAIKPLGAAMLVAGKWYVIEQEVQLNTLGASDGVMRVWINDNQVYESTTENFRGPNAWVLDTFHINVYHGGNNAPSQTIHERIGGVAVSTQRMGIPPELVQNKWPAWRRNLPLNQFSAIPNSLGVIPPGQASDQGGGQVDVFTALAVGDTAVYSLPGSGHWSNNSYRNAVYKLDLALDNPAWALDCDRTPSTISAQLDRSTNPRYELDGKPVPCQTYHASWWVPGSTMPDGKERCFQITKPVCAVPSGLNPYSVYTVDGYKTAEKAWDAGGPAPGGPTVGGTWNDYPFSHGGGYPDWAMGVDRRTGWIYISSTNIGPGSYLSVFKPNVGAGGTHESLWHQFSGKVTGVPGSFTGWQFVSFDVDTKRNRLVTLSHIGTGSVVWLNWIDLTSFAFGYLAASGTFTYNSGNGNAFCYDPDNDQYLFINAATPNVYRVDPVTAVVTLHTTLPNQDQHGIDNRLGYMPGMGGVFVQTNGFALPMFMPTKA